MWNRRMRRSLGIAVLLAAIAFVPSAGALVEQAKLTAKDGAVFDSFGVSVALSGETAIVGADLDHVGANAEQGSAYVFTRSGGVWTEEAKLTAGDGAAGDEFGFSVAISGETAIVGAYGDDAGANGDQGSAYVFIRSGGVWTQQAKLTASDGAAGDEFGRSVAISGETAIVGAGLDDVGANGNQGSAYVFILSGGVWAEQAKQTASDGAAFDLFGVSVALSGDTAIVGAYLDDVGANGDQGSAYVYGGKPTAVGLRSLSAARTERGVLVRWRTGSEAGLLGYRVYRQRGAARTAVGPLIPARAAASGRRYAFLDRTAPSGRALRYWLRIVQLDGSSAWAGSTSLGGG